MVLWEITLATAYFLGLRRTYKLALRIQRRLVGPGHPRLRSFLHGRTRIIFDVAIKVHRNIQERDIEVGRNFGNWILRWLDHAKPSAQIRSHLAELPASTNQMSTHQIVSSVRPVVKRRSMISIAEQMKRGCSFFTPWNIRIRNSPTVSMMMRSWTPASLNIPYRNVSCCASNYTTTGYRVGRSEGVFRKDIAQWMPSALAL